MTVTATTEQASLLWARFNNASAAVRRCAPMKNGGSLNENVYADTWSALVRAGLAPKLRKKYSR